MIIISKTNNAGMGDGGRIYEAERRSTSTRGMAMSDF